MYFPMYPSIHTIEVEDMWLLSRLWKGLTYAVSGVRQSGTPVYFTHSSHPLLKGPWKPHEHMAWNNKEASQNEGSLVSWGNRQKRLSALHVRLDVSEKWVSLLPSHCSLGWYVILASLYQTSIVINSYNPFENPAR